MFNLYNRYSKEILVQVAYLNMFDEEFLHVIQLRQLRKKKRTKLAWALLHIMDEVHKSHNLHNDISPNNILLHFPADESQVYIGVCDWDMATNSTEPMKPLYAFIDTISEAEELAKKWWVDPRVAYIHKEGADVQVIPRLSKASEEYVVAKIALRINRGTCQRTITSCRRGGGGGPRSWGPFTE
jgi:serine/threonine protein kinase